MKAAFDASIVNGDPAAPSLFPPPLRGRAGEGGSNTRRHLRPSPTPTLRNGGASAPCARQVLQTQEIGSP
jgi:hypothetical protein